VISYLIDIIQRVFLPLGGYGVFGASLLEEVVAPIPSAFVQMASGFLLLPADISIEFFIDLIITIVIPASLGVTIGSLFIYYLMFFVGKPVIDRYGRWLGLKWSDVMHGRERFRTSQTDTAILFFFRIAPIIPSVSISAVCGLIRMNIWRYMIWTFLGTCIRATFLAMIGWQAGALYRVYAESIERYELVVWIMLLCVIAGFLLYTFWNNRTSSS